MRIVVREVIKEPGDPFEEGQKVHDRIAPILARGEEVEVDFEGVRFLACLFSTPQLGSCSKTIL